MRSQALDETLAGIFLENASDPIRETIHWDATNVEAEREFGMLEGAYASMRLKRWADAIADLLDCDIDFRPLLSRLHQADRRLQSVKANIAFRGSVKLIEKPTDCHLTEMWRRTEHALVVAAGEWTPELMQKVAAATVGNEDRDAHLVLIECSDGQHSRSMPPLKEMFLKSRGGEVEFLSIPAPSELSFCVSDGQTGRVGSLKNVLLRNAPAIQASGVGVINALFSPVIRKIDSKGGGRWFLSQLQTQSEPDDSDPATKLWRSLIGKMDALHEDIRLRIQALADEARTATAVRAKSEVREVEYCQSFRELEPAFAERRGEIVAEWEGIDISIPQMIDSAEETLAQFCHWVSAPDRQHDLEIFLPGVPADSTKALGKVLLKALKTEPA